MFVLGERRREAEAVKIQDCLRLREMVGIMAVVMDELSLQRELAAFIGEYERANNSHDIDRVVPFIADDATYWFSDGTHQGIEEIRSAIEETFETICDEVYEVRDLEWPVVAPDVAVCRYRFFWRGVVRGEARAGQGRGTNVLVRRDGSWKMLHEHLSP